MNDEEINNKVILAFKQLKKIFLLIKNGNYQVKSCFSECDLNCDGKITEEEFYKAGKGVAEMFELEGDE